MEILMNSNIRSIHSQYSQAYSVFNYSYRAHFLKHLHVIRYVLSTSKNKHQNFWTNKYAPIYNLGSIGIIFSCILKD
jgi:hypothetical protein